MGEATCPANNGKAVHRWRFFRSGGFNQVLLETGADLMALDRLDQKLWAALSCPVKGLEFEQRTLELIDSDGDGRIRVPEIIAAVKWAGSLLKNPDELTLRAPELPLASIDQTDPEGGKVLAAARQILASMGKPGAAAITAADTADTAAIFAQARFNGDGIVPVDAADDPETQRVLGEIIDCLGAAADRSGKPGVSRRMLECFFAEAQAYDAWQREAWGDGAILPLGEATAAAFTAFQSIRGKADDYFSRCRLAGYDPRSIAALNGQESEYIAIAEKTLKPGIAEVAGFPLAQVAPGKPLPLAGGINPAWQAALAAFVAQVVRPLLGDKIALTEGEWGEIGDRLAAHEAWLARKAGAAVEKLGGERVREILGGAAREAIGALIAADGALEEEFSHIAAVDRLVRYYRDLMRLLNNFVAFRDFYTRGGKAIFQVGTLYLDGRSCDLCVRVEDVGKHAGMATLSGTCLAYCDCTRRGGSDRMTIAAAFTDGDSDFLMVGRNGIFYDRHGCDWDATIVRLVEHPISIRQAFWSPYKRVGKLIHEQILKMTSAREKAAADRQAAAIAMAALQPGAAKPPAPPPPFDAAKFAGIFAAIGLAVGAIGTAIAAVVTGFLNLVWWQMPLALVGLVLIVSGPAVIMAWLKLRQRAIGPILDANGWAINGRLRLNVAFGGSLTKVACLPEGASRSLDDPFADKKSPWPKVAALAVLLSVLLYLLYRTGLIRQWFGGIFGG
jgi:hypothetical protein